MVPATRPPSTDPHTKKSHVLFSVQGQKPGCDQGNHSQHGRAAQRGDVAGGFLHRRRPQRFAIIAVAKRQQDFLIEGLRAAFENFVGKKRESPHPGHDAKQRE